MVICYLCCSTADNTLWMKGADKSVDERWIEAINTSINNLNRRKLETVETGSVM